MEAHITEPMTMLTDYLLSGLCVLWALRLARQAHRTDPRGRASLLAWVGAFLVAGLAALVGGTAHGFKLHLGPARHAVVWQVTVYSIGASVIVLLLAGIHSARHPTTDDPARRRRGHRWLKWGLLISLVAVLIQRSGWGLHEHLNHNDIYHLAQIAGLYGFYRGARWLHGPETAP